MTDTPRTEAELLTIFADQQNHGITAQDMRDFVVSAQTPHARFYSATNGAMTIPTGTSTFPDYDQAFMFDPHGYLASGSYVSTSQSKTYPHGSWLRLPAGLWVGTLTSTWDTNTSGTRRRGLLDIIDSRLDDADYDSYIGTPSYIFGSPFGPTAEHPTRMNISGTVLSSRVATMLTISHTMTVSVDCAVGVYYDQDSGGDRSLATSDLNLWRIGPWNAGPDD